MRKINPNSLKNLRKPFSKGQSGNPSGRPSTAKAIIQEALLEEREGKTHARKIVEMQIAMAEAGEINSAEFLFAYGFGKPTQSVDMNVTERMEQLKALFPTAEELDDRKP